MLYQNRQYRIEAVLSLMAAHKIHKAIWHSVHDATTGTFVRFDIRLLNGHTISYDPKDDPSVGLAAALMVHDLPQVLLG